MHENPPENPPPVPPPSYVETDPVRRVVLVLFAAASWALAYEVAAYEVVGASSVATAFVLAGLVLLLAPGNRPTQSGFLGILDAVKGAIHGRN